MNESMDVGEYGPPRDDDELRSYVALGFQSLVGAPMPSEEGWLATWKSRSLVQGRARVVRRHGAIAAGLMDLDFGQFFGGKRVPMAGVSFVATAPEHRDRRVARSMMRAYVRELHARGDAPISALFPATQPLYRSAGFELAGWFVKMRVGIPSIRARAGELRARRMQPKDHEAIHALHRARARTCDGMLDRGPWNWGRMLDPMRGGPAHVYVFEPETEGAAIEGYVSFTQKPLDSTIGYALDVLDLCASTPRGHLAVLALLGGHRSLAPHFVFRSAPNDPFLALLDEQERHGIDERIDWMLRIVDVPRAIAARGFARSTRAHVDVDLTDDVLPENSGRFRIEVASGEGRAKRGGDGSIRLDVRALATLYAGYISAFDLHRIGKIEGDPAHVEALAEIFPVGAPFMNEMF